MQLKRVAENVPKAERDGRVLKISAECSSGRCGHIRPFGGLAVEPVACCDRLRQSAATWWPQPHGGCRAWMAERCRSTWASSFSIRATYPNLTALFAHLGVATEPSEMSFGVSLENGQFEYSGGSLAGLFAAPGNAVSPRLWSMIAEITRFYRNAPRHLAGLEKSEQTLGDYLDEHRYGEAFRRDHLLADGGRDLVGTVGCDARLFRLRPSSASSRTTDC